MTANGSDKELPELVVKLQIIGAAYGHLVDYRYDCLLSPIVNGGSYLCSLCCGRGSDDAIAS